MNQCTDKETDESWDIFMIWKINSGLVWAAGQYCGKKSLDKVFHEWRTLVFCVSFSFVVFLINIDARGRRQLKNFIPKGKFLISYSSVCRKNYVQYHFFILYLPFLPKLHFFLVRFMYVSVLLTFVVFQQNISI